ncbi:hypothetical protein ABEB36_014205 [Hypothenemus hampei]|uniref:Kazal-like domain-containing protein n=1 Tax=Hypothenemus hampei TaxID=57062 RepID=A0ABD1E3Z0_HYPHA
MALFVIFGFTLVELITFIDQASTLPAIAETKRAKRQFDSIIFPDDQNQIFFDEDNDGFAQRTPVRIPDRERTTQFPMRRTTVPVPGMGTTRTACENRCLTTTQYDPVCGDNNVTYMNMARYRCAINCGQRIRIVALRACPRVR